MISGVQILENELKDHSVSFKIDANKAFFVDLADIHWGLCDADRFKTTLETLMKIPNLYFGIGGDAGNGASKLSKANPMEEWCTGDSQIYQLAEIIKPYADRCLYIINGNHFRHQRDQLGYSPEFMLATLIGRPEIYKKEMCFLYLTVGKMNYVLFAQHQARKRDDEFSWINADIVFREHHHQKFYKEHIVLDHNKTEKRPMVRKTYEVWTGSFQVYPNYTKSKGMRPSSIGTYVVELRGHSGNAKPKYRQIFIHDDEFVMDQVERGMML